VLTTTLEILPRRSRRRESLNLRVGGFTEPSEGSIEEPLTWLAELKRQGLIRHIGLSNVTAKQLSEAQSITEIVLRAEFLQRGTQER
jgi:aryl-alcohol dehydrogenase-like predicted oxidoreductase